MHFIFSTARPLTSLIGFFTAIAALVKTALRHIRKNVDGFGDHLNINFK